MNSFSRWWEIKTYSSGCSIRKKTRFNSFAIFKEVPVPQNGARIISPSLVEAKTTCFNNCSGFWVEYALKNSINSSKGWEKREVPEGDV